MVLFFFELFLPEGLSDDSAAEDSALVDFSAEVDFFEPWLVLPEGLPALSAEDSSLVPCVGSLAL